MKEIRTFNGKLVGTLDERTGSLIRKESGKEIQIKIPPDGLVIYFKISGSNFEKIYIPPKAYKPHIV